MEAILQSSPWGSLALVSYIPDPLGSFLNNLRHSLTGEDAPHAHVTILPRRPLSIPVEIASEQILKLLTGFRSFSVEVSAVRRFRQTNVVYLDISEGSARLHALHDALSMGDLAHNEEFEFRPHLTLSFPQSPEGIEAAHKYAKAAWEAASVNRRFLLEEIVCLWLPAENTHNQWQRLWTHDLKNRQTRQNSPAALAATSQTY